MKRLESTILKNLIFNEDFTRKISPILKIEYFTDNIEKNLIVQEQEEKIGDLNSHKRFKKTLWTSIVKFTLKKTT